MVNTEIKLIIFFARQLLPSITGHVYEPGSMKSFLPVFREWISVHRLRYAKNILEWTSLFSPCGTWPCSLCFPGIAPPPLRFTPRNETDEALSVVTSETSAPAGPSRLPQWLSQERFCLQCSRLFFFPCFSKEFFPEGSPRVLPG